MCYVPSSVEHLGLTTPHFLNPNPRPQISNQIDAAGAQHGYQKHNHLQISILKPENQKMKLDKNFEHLSL